VSNIEDVLYALILLNYDGKTEKKVELLTKI